jgi:hypothetical protein
MLHQCVHNHAQAHIGVVAADAHGMHVARGASCVTGLDAKIPTSRNPLAGD